MVEKKRPMPMNTFIEHARRHQYSTITKYSALIKNINAILKELCSMFRFIFVFKGKSTNRQRDVVMQLSAKSRYANRQLFC